VARQLLALGFDAAALKGGYQAWRAAYPVESKGSPMHAPAEHDRE
jgi:rhodanese-related sulfurtransferase